MLGLLLVFSGPSVFPFKNEKKISKGGEEERLKMSNLTIICTVVWREIGRFGL